MQQPTILEGRDFQVIQIGNIPYPWHWQGLGSYTQWESGTGTSMRKAAFTEAQQQLASLNPLVNIYTPVINRDFILEQTNDERCHWEGVEGTAAEDFCSEDGFRSERYAAAAAIFQLSLLVNNTSPKDAITRVYEQALPVHHLAEEYFS